MDKENVKSILKDIQEVLYMDEMQLGKGWTNDALLQTATAVVLEDRKQQRHFEEITGLNDITQAIWK